MNDLDVLIIGGGFAGILTALHLSGLRVGLVHPTVIGHKTSSMLAQGGLAAPVSKEDSVESHIHDTMTAGAYHSDETIVREIISAGQFAVQKLTEYGVPFETTEDGEFQLKHEAAHQHPRVLSVSDSQTGRALMAALLPHLHASGVQTLEGWTAHQLLSLDGEVCGAIVECRQSRLVLRAPVVVLATGGACGLWRTCSGPPSACGEGLSLAHAVGAHVRDLEFVQFHPTSTQVNGQTVLLTEALRGAGAVIVDQRGNRVMEGQHHDLDLAPRDEVARVVDQYRVHNEPVFLDVSAVSELPTRFSIANGVVSEIDSKRIPVRCCAHYHMGGVATDLNGQTSIPGLWAIGEVASTRFHGANRLASNSLLEIAVMAPRAATDIRRKLRNRELSAVGGPCVFRNRSGPYREEGLELVRAWMDEYAGVRRTIRGLQTLRHSLGTLTTTPAVSTARLITDAALARRQSLGAHHIQP